MTETRTSVNSIKEIEGESISFDELPYWYVNEKGEGIYDYADAQHSKFVFLMEGETPYVRIITHTA